MEDSYTVHRRRKAAARKRDKTPEASRAVKEHQHEIPDEVEDNEKLEARARIERMVEDTERMEEMFNDGRNKSPDNANSRTILSPKDNDNVDDDDDNVTQVNNNDIKVDEKINDDMEKIVENKLVIIDDDKENSDKYQQERSEESQVNTTTNENRMDFKRVIKVKAETSRRDRERRLKERWSSSDSSRGAQDDDKGDKEEILKRGKKPRKIRKERKDEQQQQQQQQQQFSPSTLTHTSKQIIPLSDESLLKDLLKAQLEYERREVGILDVQIDDYVHPQMVAALRQRKLNSKQIEIKHQDSEDNPVKVPGSWSKVFTWLWSFAVKKKDPLIEEKKLIEEEEEEEKNVEEKKNPIIEEKIPIKREEIVKKESKFIGFLRLLSDIKAEFKVFADENPREIYRLRQCRNKCITQLIIIIIYCGLGAFIFRFIEGTFETFYKCGVKRVKRDFLDSLWNYSHNLREDDWKSMARRKLMEFEEQLHAAHEAGVHSYSGQKSWSFLNAVVYCLTVITTIGYGHISPSTTTGRAVTIIYAIFGIPLFLIILADFGKLFTRGIKFLWAFVRRVYYTGSCRRVRRTGPVQEVMKGVQLVYDFATFRRPSQMNPEELEEMRKQQQQQGQTVLNVDGNIPPLQPDTPATPAMSNFAIDDEFNLPISVAITILVIYIFVGATAYNLWERWGFFESFYFVFISMSTIGFGDYVPKHPIYMMCSIVYLVFGLALTSMCINVVQTMLSDSFKHATQKIGATIGFEVAEDDGSIQVVAPQSVEVAEVHATIKEEDDEQIANVKKKSSISSNNHDEQ